MSSALGMHHSSDPFMLDPLEIRAHEESSVDKVSLPIITNPLAEDLTKVIINSLEKDYELNANAKININGELDKNNEDISFSGEYISGNIILNKNKNTYFYKNNDQIIDIKVDVKKAKSYKRIFPLNLTVNFSEESILNFDDFKFAGKFNLINIDTHNNKTLSNIVGGITEITELFENKWITIDVPALKTEFPIFAEDIDDFISEIKEEIDVQNPLYYVLNNLENSGIMQISKNDSNYSIEFLDNPFFTVNSENPLKINILTNDKGVVASFDLTGEVKLNLPFSQDEFVKINFNTNIDVNYTSPKIEFPVLEKDDWEITKIITMFLEFGREYKEKELSEENFYKNFNEFTGSYDEAIDFILGNGTGKEIEFTRDYVTSAKKLDRRIRNKDLRLVLDYNDSPKYILTDIIYYLEKGDNEYYQKRLFEEFLGIFNEDMMYSPYVKSDIFEEINISFKTRGDILIFLAKNIKANKLK
jgi:hypothetical protein